MISTLSTNPSSEWVSGERLLFNANSVIVQLYHVENKLIFNGWLGPLCTRSTRWVRFFIVVACWHNSPQIDMLPHTLSWFRAKQSLIFFLITDYPDFVFAREATNTNVIVFGLTRSVLAPTIYHNRGEYANHYTTDAVKRHLIIH